MPIFQNQSRHELRQMYVEVWRKQRDRLPLEPLEAQIAQVIAEHPEYQSLLDDRDTALTRDFTPEGGQTNPFLHMALHLTVRDQIATDRPLGVRAAYETLIRRRDPHEVEHAMLEHLAEALWQAQRDNVPPNEQVYLRRVQKMAR
jgi:hypothetical protein